LSGVSLMLLSCTARSRSVPSSLRSSPGSTIATTATATLTKRGLLVGELTGLTLKTSVHVPTITSLRVTSILELVVALLESSASSKAMLLTVSLTVSRLAASTLTSVRCIAHTAISTSVGIRTTESTISTVSSTTAKATAVVSKTTTASVWVTANGGTVRSRHVGSLHTLWARDDVVLDFFALCQALETTFIVDGSVVDENLIHRSTLGAFSGNDKAESLLAVEELDSSGPAIGGGHRHCCNWKKKRIIKEAKRLKTEWAITLQTDLFKNRSTERKSNELRN